jgi:hypothetical protein
VRRALVVLALLPLLVAASCGDDPKPSPSPSPSPTPTPDSCTTTPSAYGKAVTDWWVPLCSLAQNIYNDPAAALGPSDAGGSGPDKFTGFVSLGFGGRVTLDMGGCVNDRSGNDLRVFQAVGSEPLSVYVSLSPAGPWRLLEARKTCGERVTAQRGYCDFDLATASVTRFRYVRVEDGELWPCPGDSLSEGADLDAVQALGVTP